MRALDTNLLIRFLVQDDRKQAKRVLALFEEAEEDGSTLYIPSVVILETIWVLASAYACTREEIIDSLEELAAMPVLALENPDTLHRVIADGRSSSIGLADLLIGHTAAAAGCEETLTFDRHASKHRLFVRV